MAIKTKPKGRKRQVVADDDQQSAMPTTIFSSDLLTPEEEKAVYEQVEDWLRRYRSDDGAAESLGQR